LRKLSVSPVIKEYMPRVSIQVSELERLVAYSAGEPVLLNDVMRWFAFDSIDEFAFNEGFDMMKSKTYHPAIVQQNSALALLGCVNSAV
jgi:hypothetical protein